MKPSWTPDPGSALLLAVLISGAETAAGATSTRCSNPDRAGVRAATYVRLPAGGPEELEAQLSAAAGTRLGMSAGTVTAEDPYKRPPLRTRDQILQSPQSSVVIEIRSSNYSDRARITVERTCYSDALEDWRPYWRGLRAVLREHGYRLRPR